MGSDSQGTSGRALQRKSRRWIAATGILLVVVGGALWLWQRQSNASDHERRAAELSGLGKAISVYSAQFDDQMPASLPDPGFGPSAKRYVLLQPGGKFLENPFASTKPLIIERPAEWPKSDDLGVLYYDGHVQFRERAEVEAMVPKD